MKPSARSDTLLRPIDQRLLINAAWLIKLRWVAVVGQLTTIMIVQRVLRVEIPIAPLLVLVGMTALLGLSPVQDFLGIEIASAWVGLISIGATLVAMVFGSVCFPDRRSPTKPVAPLVIGSGALLAGAIAFVAVVALVIVAIFGAWRQLWMVVLVGGIGLFALLAVFVTVGGFFDVVKLIKKLRQPQKPEDQQQPQRDS